jgi:hypothetical protein
MRRVCAGAQFRRCTISAIASSVVPDEKADLRYAQDDKSRLDYETFVTLCPLWFKIFTTGGTELQGFTENES